MQFYGKFSDRGTPRQGDLPEELNTRVEQAYAQLANGLRPPFEALRQRGIDIESLEAYVPYNTEWGNKWPLMTIAAAERNTRAVYTLLKMGLDPDPIPSSPLNEKIDSPNPLAVSWYQSGKSFVDSDRAPAKTDREVKNHPAYHDLVRVMIAALEKKYLVDSDDPEAMQIALERPFYKTPGTSNFSHVGIPGFTDLATKNRVLKSSDAVIAEMNFAIRRLQEYRDKGRDFYLGRYVYDKGMPRDKYSPLDILRSTESVEPTKAATAYKPNATENATEIEPPAVGKRGKVSDSSDAPPLRLDEQPFAQSQNTPSRVYRPETGVSQLHKIARDEPPVTLEIAPELPAPPLPPESPSATAHVALAETPGVAKATPADNAGRGGEKGEEDGKESKDGKDGKGRGKNDSNGSPHLRLDALPLPNTNAASTAKQPRGGWRAGVIGGALGVAAVAGTVGYLAGGGGRSGRDGRVVPSPVPAAPASVTFMRAGAAQQPQPKVVQVLQTAGERSYALLGPPDGSIVAEMDPAKGGYVVIPDSAGVLVRIKKKAGSAPFDTSNGKAPPTGIVSLHQSDITDYNIDVQDTGRGTLRWNFMLNQKGKDNRRWPFVMEVDSDLPNEYHVFSDDRTTQVNVKQYEKTGSLVELRGTPLEIAQEFLSEATAKAKANLYPPSKLPAPDRGGTVTLSDGREISSDDYREKMVTGASGAGQAFQVDKTLGRGKIRIAYPDSPVPSLQR